MAHELPPHLIEVAIEPKSIARQEKLDRALTELAAEDPSFEVSLDHESGQIIMKGMSESHLATKVDHLIRAYGLDVNIGAPQVAFRERPTERVEHAFTHKRQSGGKGQFASVTLVVEPNEPDSGYAFESRIAEGTLPPEFIPGVEKGIASVLTSGVVAGFPVVDVKVALIDGKYHDVDSSVLAFEIAARACFREALQKAKSVLLEPIVKVEVITPVNAARVVLADLRSRRGQIEAKDLRGDTLVITAVAPLMVMFGYPDVLGALSDGRATLSMQFDHYAVAPPNVTDDGGPPFMPAIGMRA